MANELAIFGGPKAVSDNMPRWPVIDEDDRRSVLDVLDSGRLWMYGSTEGGWTSRVERFEREFAALHRVKRGVAVSSGSMALEVCMRAIDLRPGDEVITTAYSFVATASCVSSVGALPVFVDIDPETYNIDPRRIEEAITPRTRAILPVHFSGEIADMDAINAIAARRGLRVIEDAAHAHAGSIAGPRGPRYAGSLGTAGCFSLQESKNLTCGEGGIILTDDEDFAERCWSLRHYGRSRTGAWYDHPGHGTNGRLNELSAGLLLSQLRKLPEQTRVRQANVKRLYDALADCPGIRPVRLHPQGVSRSHHLVMLRFIAAQWPGVDRATFIQAANAEGIPISAGYIHPLYHNGMFQRPELASRDHAFMIGRDAPIDYRRCAERCPNAERACNEEALWLTHPNFIGDPGRADRIAAGLLKLWEQRDKLRAIKAPSGPAR